MMAGADWRSIVSDQVTVAATEVRGAGTSSLQRFTRVAFSVDAHPFLLRAAQRRGISLSGYTRRAALARVAADLGLDPMDLFRLDSGVSPYGAGGGGVRELDLDGELYGRWEVDCDGRE